MSSGAGDAPWRLVVDGAGDGAWNMAVDEALLEARRAGRSGPVLRMYRWRAPTVTLGRYQSAADVDLEACAALGVDVVRRPTGGRGVLHDDELTYAVIASTEDGLPRGVAASYRLLGEALAEAYRLLGVGAELTARDRHAGRSGACYLHASRADLSLGAAKLSGSAQVWRQHTCLQHGSFVRSRDAALEARVFGLDAAERRSLERSTATLASALGDPPPLMEVASAVREAFARVLGVEAMPSTLAASESRVAASLVRAVVDLRLSSGEVELEAEVSRRGPLVQSTVSDRSEAGGA